LSSPCVNFVPALFRFLAFWQGDAEQAVLEYK